jgi:hypothetical protein
VIFRLVLSWSGMPLSFFVNRSWPAGEAYLFTRRASGVLPYSFSVRHSFLCRSCLPREGGASIFRDLLSEE